MHPDDEQKRLAERERGHRARQITEHPLWAEAWEAFEAAMMDGWRRSQTGEAERREQIYSQLRAGEFARKYIEGVFLTGEMAEMQLEERSNGGTSRSTAQH